MGIKMVLSGEGADEIFGGYLYFHKAPKRASSTRRRRKLTLHLYDCLRANKARRLGRRGPRSVPRHGFLDVAMTLRPGAQKMVARRPDREVPPAQGLRRRPARRDALAPEGAVLRRRRLRLDRPLKAHAEARVTDASGQAGERFPMHAGDEGGYLYRSIFEDFPAALRRRMRAVWPERRVFFGRCARVGSVVQGERGSERESGQGRAQALGLTRRDSSRPRTAAVSPIPVPPSPARA